MWLRPFYARPCYTCVIFLSNLSRNAVARQFAGKVHSVNQVVSHLFFVARSVARSRTQFFFLQRIAAAGNTTAQCITRQQLFSLFLQQFLKGCVHTLLIFRSEELWVREQGQKYCPRYMYIFKHCETSC